MDLDSVRVYTDISTYGVFGLGKLMPEISAADDIALLIYIALSALLVFTTYKVYEQKHAIQKSATIGTYYVTAEKFNELRRFECHPGDILMSCSGTMGELFLMQFSDYRNEPHYFFPEAREAISPHTFSR